MKKILALVLILVAFAAGRTFGIHHALIDCEIEKAPYLVLIHLDGETYAHYTSVR